MVDRKLARIRDIKEDKALCEWLDGAELRSGWYPLDLIPALPSDEELEAQAERERRRSEEYNPYF